MNNTPNEPEQESTTQTVYINGRQYPMAVFNLATGTTQVVEQAPADSYPTHVDAWTSVVEVVGDEDPGFKEEPEPEYTIVPPYPYVGYREDDF